MENFLIFNKSVCLHKFGQSVNSLKSSSASNFLTLEAIQFGPLNFYSNYITITYNIAYNYIHKYSRHIGE